MTIEGEQTRQTRIMAGLSDVTLGKPLYERICREALTRINVGTAALILMSDQEAGALVTASDGQAAAVEDLQFALGEGPCLEAYRTGRTVVAANLMNGAAAKWPRFATAAMEKGVHSVFAVPLQLGAIRIGVLYLTRTTAEDLTRAQLADAFSLAEIATVALLEQQAGAVTGELGDTLRRSWTHRAVVHQATGMVSAQLALPLADALVRLRNLAYDSGRSIYDLAGDVVARRLRIEP
ncbi:MAG TPA: GAF and ANTAR domain-containing protein [Actinomycetota bacterium]